MQILTKPGRLDSLLSRVGFLSCVELILKYRMGEINQAIIELLQYGLEVRCLRKIWDSVNNINLTIFTIIDFNPKIALRALGTTIS